MKKLNYELLASLPLFLGIDASTLTDIHEAVGPAVQTMRRGSTIIRTGDDCRSLLFLLEGRLDVATTFCSGKLSLSESLRATAVVEPQCLFGLHTTYTRTYTAAETGSYIRLPKSLIVQQMMKNEVFRFNFTNMLSSGLQDASQRLRRNPASSIERRIVEIFARQTLRPSGEKTIRCKMTDLAPLCGTTRLTLSRTLHSLEKRGLIRITRGMIIIPAFERLDAETM